MPFRPVSLLVGIPVSLLVGVVITSSPVPLLVGVDHTPDPGPPVPHFLLKVDIQGRTKQ